MIKIYRRTVLSKLINFVKGFYLYGFISAHSKMSRVYIGRLSYQAREKDIERFFKNYGHIREINLKNGFGFVVSIVPSSNHLFINFKLT